MRRDAGIGQFEYMVLSALSMAPRRTMPMSVLAGYTAATLSRLSNVVSRLERRGWVQRAPDPADGRTTLAALTGDGFTVVEESAPRHVAEVRRLVFDPLTRAQQRQLGVIASRILRAIDQGFEALMAGRDHVIGGDRATWRAAVINKFLPERVKAHRQGNMARPS